MTNYLSNERLRVHRSDEQAGDGAKAAPLDTGEIWRRFRVALTRGLEQRPEALDEVLVALEEEFAGDDGG